MRSYIQSTSKQLAHAQQPVKTLSLKLLLCFWCTT